MQLPELKTKRKATKTKIKLWIQQTEKELPDLQAGADAVGSCWESEKLGFARGYIAALKEVIGERD